MCIRDRYRVPVQCTSTEYQYSVPVQCTSTVYQYRVPVQSTSTEYQYRVQYGVPVQLVRNKLFSLLYQLFQNPNPPQEKRKGSRNTFSFYYQKSWRSWGFDVFEGRPIRKTFFFQKTLFLLSTGAPDRSQEKKNSPQTHVSSHHILVTNLMLFGVFFVTFPQIASKSLHKPQCL